MWGLAVFRMGGRAGRGLARGARGGAGSNPEPSAAKRPRWFIPAWAISGASLLSLFEHWLSFPMLALIVVSTGTVYGVPVAIAHRGRPSEKQEKKQIVNDFRAFREGLTREDKTP
jgi:hypothetical protein